MYNGQFFVAIIVPMFVMRQKLQFEVWYSMKAETVRLVVNVGVREGKKQYSNR